METRIIIAGSGGQGILFLGKIMAVAGMVEGREVTWFPSYGAEMRGGTANCTVIISDEMIGSPVVQTPDVLIATNAASLEKFQNALRKKGLLVFDSSLIRNPALRPDIEPLAVPATELANAVGSTKAANMVILGAFLSRTRLLEERSVMKAIEDTTRRNGGNALRVNKNSVLKGIQYLGHQAGRTH